MNRPIAVFNICGCSRKMNVHGNMNMEEVRNTTAEGRRQRCVVRKDVENRNPCQVLGDG